ncbi:MAG: hypothetical protein OXI81_00380 [Paracoccaceae bacterium]|nr:hypothetical protein [Paracoccaceae bacterium]
MTDQTKGCVSVVGRIPLMIRTAMDRHRRNGASHAAGRRCGAKQDGGLNQSG